MTTIRSQRMSAVRRRGGVTLVVLWAVAIAAIVVAATQVLAWRQAIVGREALARVQARWAARAGVEQMIAIMEYYALHPVPDDAKALIRDLEEHCIGETETGEFDIRHFRDGVAYAGPMDEHSKLNVNIASRAQLLGIPFMTPDVVDAIIDWRDADDNAGTLGAEAEYYANRGFKYRPRNGNFRSIAELELVAGCWPQYVRGEDWNLNGRLDPNEDDGSISPPDDKPDGILDAGWSGYLTAYSRGSHIAPSGQQKLYLRQASSQQLQERLGINEAQAVALITWARGPSPRMEELLLTPLGELSQQRQGGAGAASGTGGETRRPRAGPARPSGGRTSASGGAASASIAPLSSRQLRLVLAECTLDDPFQPAPGRVNLNSVSSDVLQRAFGLDARTADAIVARRNSRSAGFTSLADLLEIGDLKPETIRQLAGQFDVVSNVYLISSRGRALSTGTEMEMIAVIDRSTLPITFIEVREP